MSLLVLAFPALNKKDYEWIQSIREKYDDRYYKVVDPHFTIVFPVFDFEESVFVSHIETLAKDVEPIEFSVQCTTIVKDSFSDYTDIFLVPDKGNSDIIRLHDRLYMGVLKSELRLNIPFIPHIGIGAATDPVESKRISDKINETRFCIEGKINTLSVCRYDYPKVEIIKRISLD